MFLCAFIHERVPEITTINVSVSSRGNKLYIDPNQNDYADRVAAVYCVRAYHSPNVSTPLEWKEVSFKLNPHDYTIKTVAKRLEKKGRFIQEYPGPENQDSKFQSVKKVIVVWTSVIQLLVSFFLFRFSDFNYHPSHAFCWSTRL